MNQVPGQPYLGYNGGYGGTQVIRIDDSETIKVLRENISILRERVVKYEEGQEFLTVTRRAWVVVARNLAKTTKEKTQEEVDQLFALARKLCQKQFDKEGIKVFSKNVVIFDLAV